MRKNSLTQKILNHKFVKKAKKFKERRRWGICFIKMLKEGHKNKKRFKTRINLRLSNNLNSAPIKLIELLGRNFRNNSKK